jgi:uncharacterized protein DUF1905/bacteriocin resistance YdeI/OmpD-like protein
MEFHAPIAINGINPYVLVSRARAEVLQPGWRKPMPVRIQINGKPEVPWRINMMPRGDGSFFLYLHGSVRSASRTQVGDRVTVFVAFDETYRSGPVHRMPSAFRAALAADKHATTAWRALPPSRKKEVLRYFAVLKSREALTRNIASAVAVLSGKNARFMGREWKDGK